MVFIEMEIPENCADCPCVHEGMLGFFCGVTHDGVGRRYCDITQKRYETCPIRERKE